MVARRSDILGYITVASGTIYTNADGTKVRKMRHLFYRK
jgi:hypothetical protein